MRSPVARAAVDIGLLILVNMCWGMQFTAYKLVGNGIGPVATSFLIYLISVPAVFPLYLRERWKGVGPLPLLPIALCCGGTTWADFSPSAWWRRRRNRSVGRMAG